MLSQANLSREFWAEAEAYVCHIINHFPATENERKTPLDRIGHLLLIITYCI